MMILGGADLDKRSSNPGRGPAILERYISWMRSLQESGAYQSSGKLQDQIGARLSVRGGEVVEGPFIESKEAVGGYFIVSVASLDAAKAIARECPVLDLQ